MSKKKVSVEFKPVYMTPTAAKEGTWQAEAALCPLFPINESVVVIDHKPVAEVLSEGGISLPLTLAETGEKLGTEARNYGEATVLRVSPGLRTKEGIDIKPGMVIWYRAYTVGFPVIVVASGRPRRYRRLGIMEIHGIRDRFA